VSVTKILVVDDHSLMRDGLCRLLSLEPTFNIIDQASNGLEAIERVQQEQPDVILMDINMPKLNGIDATKEIHKLYPEIKVIALTVCEQDDQVFEFIRAGASGYILKDAQAEVLIDAVKTICNGKSYIYPSIAHKVLNEFNRVCKKLDEVQKNPLSSREIEVLTLVSKGYTNKRIGSELFISEKTVKNHITNIFHKLEAKDRTEAVVIAMKGNLIIS